MGAGFTVNNPNAVSAWVRVEFPDERFCRITGARHH
jgi:hypothetical protein